MSEIISVIGSTGSIGRQTLEVAEQLGLRTAALTARTGGALLEEQVRKFRPRLAVRRRTRWSPRWWAPRVCSPP